MGESPAVERPAPAGGPRLALDVGVSVLSAVCATLAGALVGWLVAFGFSFLGYGYTHFVSVAVRVVLALALFGGCIALAVLDRLPLIVGGGLLTGGALSILFVTSWTAVGGVAIFAILAALVAVALSHTQIPTLMRREFSAYFFSPIAYVVATVFILFFGLLTYLVLSTPQAEATLIGPIIFSTMYLLPILAPVLTMRLLSEEMRSGTIEVLMTGPVRDWEVVVSKYLTAVCTFLVMLLPTLIHVLALFLVSERGPSMPELVGAYSGFILIACLYIAIGTFSSSLARDQIVAAIIGFAFSFILFIAPFFSRLAQGSQTLSPEAKARVARILDFISPVSHLYRLALGSISTSSILFFASTIVFILFVTVRVVESRKWR